MDTNTIGAMHGTGAGSDSTRDAMARLASGVAHEINTPIQFVSDSLRFLNDAFGDVTRLVDRWHDVFEAAHAGAIPPQLLADAEEALEEADVATLRKEIPSAVTRALEGLERVADVVRRVRAIVPPESPRTLTDLRVVLDEVATLARVEFLKSVDFEIEIDPELPPVDGNGADLHQLFFSMIARAARAIAAVPNRRQGARGRIRVAADKTEKAVRVSFEDDGIPIPSERCQSLFQRCGDGNDLSFVHEVVRGTLNGRILFESGVGHGTRFHLLIPFPKRFAQPGVAR